MKKGYFTSLFIFISIWSFGQIVNIPDASFKYALVNLNCAILTGNTYVDVDTNNDGEIQITEALAVRKLKIQNFSFVSANGLVSFSNLTSIVFQNVGFLSDLNISNFNYLTYLEIAYAPDLTTATVSNCSQLAAIKFEDNISLPMLSLSNLPTVVTIECTYGILSTLNMSNLPQLKKLNCERNQITALDVSNFPLLEELVCYQNNLQTLTLGSLQNLTKLECFYNQLQSLNVHDLTNLELLRCSNNLLTSIDTSSLANLTLLYCDNNLISSVNLNSSLKYLSIYRNLLTELPVSNLVNLLLLSCASNQLTSLDINNLNLLNEFHCSFNFLTTLSIIDKPALNDFTCSNNQLTSLNLNNVPNLFYFSCAKNFLTTLNVPVMLAGSEFSCAYNLLTQLDLTNQTGFYSLNVSYNQLTDFVVPKVSFEGGGGVLNISGNLYNTVSFQEGSLLSSFTCNDSALNTIDFYNVETTIPENDYPFSFALNNNLSLQSINFKNNTVEYFNCSNCPSISNNPLLTAICADENELSTTQNAFGNNVTVGSDCSLGNQDLSLSQWKLYPNPTSNILHLMVENTTRINEIRIVNLMGQVVKTITESAPNSNTSIDVSQLKAGTYFVEIFSAVGKTTKKIIKI
ncbi:MAG: T9SS type A sorting domain-containing protein [Flavobacterium sp.]|nr:T9SS type A sorting domain-containing protein [Flavobacterium sp.]